MTGDRVIDRFFNVFETERGMLYIRSNRCPRYLDQFGQSKYTSVCTDLAAIVFLALMFASITVPILIILSIFVTIPGVAAVQEFVSLVVIPEGSEILSISAAVYIVASVCVAVVVHEFAHGVAMRAEDISIEEIGIECVLVFPVAAYVIPVDDSYEAASIRSRIRILSAGVFANVLL